MLPDEIDDLVSYLGANPAAGDVIVGTGGARKVRFAKRGGGKSGGYRVITFYTGPELPVFLIAVFSQVKGSTCPALNAMPSSGSLPVWPTIIERG